MIGKGAMKQCQDRAQIGQSIGVTTCFFQSNTRKRPSRTEQKGGDVLYWSSPGPTDQKQGALTLALSCHVARDPLSILDNQTRYSPFPTHSFIQTINQLNWVLCIDLYFQKVVLCFDFLRSTSKDLPSYLDRLCFCIRASDADAVRATKT